MMIKTYLNLFLRFSGYSKTKLGLSHPDRGCFLDEYGVEVLSCPSGYIYKFGELPDCSIKHELCLGSFLQGFESLSTQEMSDKFYCVQFDNI